MFKYNLDQVVFYMLNNVIHSASILSRMCVENLHENWAITKEQKELFTPFGNSRILYATTHGFISENVVFASKEELLKEI